MGTLFGRFFIFLFEGGGVLYSVPKNGTPKVVPYLRGGTSIAEVALFWRGSNGKM